MDGAPCLRFLGLRRSLLDLPSYDNDASYKIVSFSAIRDRARGEGGQDEPTHRDRFRTASDDYYRERTNH
ncbi:hypothetical protein SBA4_4440004 [Candidatus Sulfopaludibacter sp. SbA4]|nr:hypothetical protein SBA4_4440004 [Candidatus Sulfopaludibacter sp. SbA4]